MEEEPASKFTEAKMREGKGEVEVRGCVKGMESGDKNYKINMKKFFRDLSQGSFWQSEESRTWVGEDEKQREDCSPLSTECLETKGTVWLERWVTLRKGCQGRLEKHECRQRERKQLLKVRGRRE